VALLHQPTLNPPGQPPDEEPIPGEVAPERSGWGAFLPSFGALTGALRWFTAAPRDPRFVPYATTLTARNMRGGMFLFLFVDLAWWPMDLVLFRHEPHRLAIFFQMRAVSAVILGVLQGLVPRITRTEFGLNVLLFSCTVAIGLGLGGVVAELGRGGASWFQYLYVLPFLGMIMVVPFWKRCAMGVLLVATNVAGFVAQDPERLADPQLGVAVSFSFFTILMQAVLGHQLYRVLEQKFVLQTRIEAFNGSLRRTVASQTADLRRLASHLVRTREDEATRLSRELHDELGQHLAALRMAIHHARTRYAQAPTVVGANLADVERLVNGTTTAMRQVLAGLRPRLIEDAGLIEALRWLVSGAQERTGVASEMVVTGEAREVPIETGIMLFRIVQEALTNVQKHSAATRVELALSFEPGGLSLVVADDGVGVDAAALRSATGFGLLGIRERVHALGGRIDLGPGIDAAGVALRVWVPSEASEESAA
jgi:signal transduction histidine kinase